MSRKTKIILAVVALAVIGGIVAAIALGGGKSGPEVEVAEVLEEDLSVTVTASGQLESGVRADVYPPTAGTLISVNAEDNAQVKAGDILAQMDPTPLQAAVSQAEAALAAAQAQLAGVNKQEPSSDDLAAARSGTDAAWSSYEAAVEGVSAVDDQAPSSADLAAAAAGTSAAYNGWMVATDAYDALKFIYETSSSPTPELEAELAAAQIAMEQAEAGYYQAKSAEDKLKTYDDTVARKQAQAAADQAYAGYLSAHAQQTKLESTSFSAERHAAQTSVDQAREALFIAQENLTDATLRAPIDGTVLFNSTGVPNADGAMPKPAEGSAVAPQSAPFTVVDLEGLKFVAEVDEVDVSRVVEGMAAIISLDAFSADSFAGEVFEIAPAARQTLTGGTVFPVDLLIENESGADLLIGMKGDAEVEVNSVPSVLTIPIEALFDEGGTSFVYLVESGVLLRTEVEIGTLTETSVEVVSGVAAGDTVALSGAVELVDGMSITSVE